MADLRQPRVLAGAVALLDQREDFGAAFDDLERCHTAKDAIKESFGDEPMAFAPWVNAVVRERKGGIAVAAALQFNAHERVNVDHFPTICFLRNKPLGISVENLVV